MAKILCQAKLPPCCAGVTNELAGRVLIDLGANPDSLMVKLKPPLFICADCAEWAETCGSSVIRYTRGLRLVVEVVLPGLAIPRKMELAELFCDRKVAEAHLAWAHNQVRGFLWWAGWRNSSLDPKVEETLALVRTALAEGDFGLAVELAESVVAEARQAYHQAKGGGNN